MESQQPISVAHAPAKLNLSLTVLQRRPDGFHEIESLMVGTTLCDTLEVKLAREDGENSLRSEPPIRLRVSYSGRLATAAGAALRRDVPTDARNLVVRAVTALAKAAGESRGLEIDLVKRIPAGAGLGGGSSDAATVLRAAGDVWGLDWPEERLAAIGAELGSDISWFFAGGPAIARGRGERIEPLHDLPALAAVIACPGDGLATPEVYRNCRPDASRKGSAAKLAALLAEGRLRAAMPLMHNDLEAPAKRLCPDVDRLLAALRRAGAAHPMLTGSGSACFALMPTAELAQRIASRLELEGWPGVFVVRLAPSRQRRLAAC